MRPKIISNSSSPAIVTTSSNVTQAAGTPTPIFTLTVPQGTSYALLNAAKIRGAMERGLHLILDLRTSSGAKISPASRLVLAVKGVNDELPRPIKSIPYGVWYDLTTTQQRSDDYKYGIVSAFDLNVPVGLDLQPQDKLIFMVDSPDTVDWSANSKSLLEFTVQEQN